MVELLINWLYLNLTINNNKINSAKTIPKKLPLLLSYWCFKVFTQLYVHTFVCALFCYLNILTGIDIIFVAVLCYVIRLRSLKIFSNIVFFFKVKEMINSLIK